jgi:hypothetical protein
VKLPGQRDEAGAAEVEAPDMAVGHAAEADLLDAMPGVGSPFR